MKRLVKFLIPLLALALFSIPAWAATAGKLAIDNLAGLNLQTDDASNLMAVDILNYQYVLAKGGNGGRGGNGGGSRNCGGDCGGNGSGDGMGNGKADGDGDCNGNGGGDGSGQKIQNQYRHQHQKHYKTQHDEKQLYQNQNEHQLRHGESR